MSDIGQKIIAGLKDINDRLAIANGHIEATGLRMTTMRLCHCHTKLRRSPYVVGRHDCPDCGGKGFIRTVNDGSGRDN
jgi:hypothetical protein